MNSYGHGWVEAIVGSMFSGKSEELIRRILRAKYAKQKILVFKHSFDKRYSIEKVASHSGQEIEAIPVTNIKEMERILNDNKEVEVIGIDEVQFFEKDIVKFIDNLANQGKRVIVAGLDQDFRGEPFYPVPDIMAKAEKVDKLNAICSVSGLLASRTQRIIDGEPAHYDDSVVMIGANECYEARSRAHHIVKKKDKEKVEE